jgi:hypothetical protein
VPALGNVALCASAAMAIAPDVRTGIWFLRLIFGLGCTRLASRPQTRSGPWWIRRGGGWPASRGVVPDCGGEYPGPKESAESRPDHLLAEGVEPIGMVAASQQGAR